ncbi:MAG: NAD(+)/NADH kinase [Lachnospiraceae bacterium]|jgi:NAD+ kinase|nr:NAD(+)/NADH kinase [Lachnospiraceae bacterium]
MRSFYIVTNPGKEGAAETAAEIGEYLRLRDARCLIQSYGDIRNGRYTEASQVPQDTDCVITIGGDGTLIQAARDLAGRRIPFIGVNKGHLGYLTQVNDRQEVKGMLDALLEGRYRLESRMMLSGQVVRKGRNIFQDIALNEIVLSRKDALKPLHFRIFVNGEFLNDYTADGMIFATPTGSTAYNLSAGGPIVAPGARMMILTPICSHALNARSIVLPEEDHITIEILDEGHMAAFDGNLGDEVKKEDQIIIRRSRLDTVLVQLKQVSFLQNLSSKMAGI